MPLGERKGTGAPSGANLVDQLRPRQKAAAGGWEPARNRCHKAKQSGPGSPAASRQKAPRPPSVLSKLLRAQQVALDVPPNKTAAAP